MPDRRDGAERSAVSRRSPGAWAVSLFLLGLLLFIWPFVRTPLLDIGRSYAHLIAAWALLVAGLAALARALGRREAPSGDDDA